MKTDEKTKEALQELLRILSDHPEVADRITITIRPAKIKQGTDKRKHVGRGSTLPPMGIITGKERMIKSRRRNPPCFL